MRDNGEGKNGKKAGKGRKAEENGSNDVYFEGKPPILLPYTRWFLLCLVHGFFMDLFFDFF